jgi:hypothetical protein
MYIYILEMNMADQYTKGVLTVIAVALVGLFIQSTIRPVGAQPGIQRVAICDPNDFQICAQVFKRNSFDNNAFLSVFSSTSR